MEVKAILRFMIDLKHLVSSANERSFEYETAVGRSLVYTRKSKGPRILPWGTPESTGGRKLEEWLLTLSS